MLRNRTSNWRLILLNALIIMVATILVVIGVAGYNTISNTFDFGQGVTQISDMFGGLRSFGALMALIIGGVVVWMTVTKLADSNKSNHWAGALALVFVIIAMFVGSKWIDLPTGSGLIVFGYFVVVLIAAVLVTQPRTKVIATPAKTSTTTAAPATVTS